MIVKRAYRHKAVFSLTQEQQAREFAGCARLIYNSGLEQRNLGYSVTGKSMSYWRQTSYLTEAKNAPGFEFLRDAPAHVLQQALRDLDKAFASFFAGLSGYPRPRKRGEHDGFRFPDPDPKQVGVHDPAHIGQVRLPKFGWVSIRNSYPRLKKKGLLFEGCLKNVSVVREADGWYLSFCCEVEIETPVAPTGPAISFDRGIANSLTSSEGEFIHLPVITAREWEKIGFLQLAINRCQKGSRNRERAKGAFARYQQHLRRRKVDAIHKLTTTFSKERWLIGLEDLRVKNMSASATGTVEGPGKNVAQKRGLNREILNQSWAEQCRQFDYKTVWYGSELEVVPAYNSSNECRVCRHVAKANRKSQAVFLCVACGHAEHADVNAAGVILSRALAQHGSKTQSSETKSKKQSSEIVGPIGGTSIREQKRKLSCSNACEGSASLKNPEAPKPSRKRASARTLQVAGEELVLAGFYAGVPATETSAFRPR